MVRAASRAGKFRIVAAGSPARGQSTAVARSFDARAEDDLRSMLLETDAALVWLAATGEFGNTGTDAQAVLSAASRGVIVASTEPLPSSAFDLAQAGWGWGEDGQGPGLAGDRLRFVALPRRTRAWREAADVLAAFGPPRMMQVEAWGGPSHGTLAARMFGAMDLVFSLMGEPDAVDAAYVGPRRAAGLHALPGETMRHLQGDLAATMRFHDGRAAMLAASDAAGRWNCTTTLISEQGRLRFYDDGFEWIGPDGAKRDEMRFKRSRGDQSVTDAGALVAGESIARMLGDLDPGPSAVGSVLPLCQAALLSARTGNPESPESIRRMMVV